MTTTLGTNVLLGLDPSRLQEIPERLEARREHTVPPLWDGLAGRRAALEIEQLLGVSLPSAA